jgi:hypothetical protein
MAFACFGVGSHGGGSVALSYRPTSKVSFDESVERTLSGVPRASMVSCSSSASRSPNQPSPSIWSDDAGCRRRDGKPSSAITRRISPPLISARLAAIDAVLGSAPWRVRELPVRRALWRFSLLDVAELALLYAVLSASAKAGRADPSTALSAGATASVFASLSTLDAIVVRVVGKALLGDMRAISWICDVIEGRPERCRGDVRASPRRLLSSAHAKNLRPGGWLTDFMSAFLLGITLASADTAKFQIASGRGKAGL